MGLRYCISVMQKLGMQLEEIQHDHEDHRDWHVYGMEKCDWK